MALDSIGSDSNLKLSTIKPVSGIVPTNTAIPADNKSGNNIAIKSDGANVNSSKGKIPASGSIFGGSETSPASKGAEAVIQQYAGDKKQLQAFSSALENLDLSNGIDGISDDALNELMTLGFDISMDHGKLVIKDSSGNDVSVEDFMKLKDNLSNTLKRAISNVNNVSKTAAPTASTEIKAGTQMSDKQQTEFLNDLKGYSETTVHVQEVSNPMKQKLETSIKEYEAKVSEAEKQSQKIDMSISQILALRTQAEALVDKSKGKPLTDIEKKQLQSLVSTIQLKQKELISNQQGNEILMSQIDQVYSQFSGELSAPEKETKDAMQVALKAKISGQALSVRQNFLATISEDIYKATSNMSESEVQNLMTDSSARVKMLAPVNKLLDRVNGAKTKADISAADQDMLWSKFKIKAVEENGKLELYYYANEKAQPQKVSKEDLKSMRTDLNNVVSSPQLFTLARASGQIAIAYDNTLAERAREATGQQPVGPSVEANAKKADNTNYVPDDKKSDKEYNSKNVTIDDEVRKKSVDQNQRSSLDKSMEEKRESEKYHEKQIEHIHDMRRQTNRYLDQKRTAEQDQKISEEIRLNMRKP